MNKQKNRKRYNLHYALRKKGFVIATKSKTVFVPASLVTLPKQLTRLKESFHYCLQLTID